MNETQEAKERKNNFIIHNEKVLLLTGAKSLGKYSPCILIHIELNVIFCVYKFSKSMYFEYIVVGCVETALHYRSFSVSPSLSYFYNFVESLHLYM